MILIDFHWLRDNFFPLFSNLSADLHRHSAETTAVMFNYRPSNGVHYTDTPIASSGIRIVNYPRRKMLISA
jgi:hypothetical protein